MFYNNISLSYEHRCQLYITIYGDSQQNLQQNMSLEIFILWLLVAVTKYSL